jgi:hypothetical protein
MWPVARAETVSENREPSSGQEKPFGHTEVCILIISRIILVQLSIDGTYLGKKHHNKLKKCYNFITKTITLFHKNITQI